MRSGHSLAKLRASADSLVRQWVTRAELDNLTLMEVNTPGLSSHQLHYKLRTHLQPSEGAQSQDFEGETGSSRPLSEAGGSRVVCERSGLDRETHISGVLEPLLNV